MSADDLYTAVMLFLDERGWRREELGSGWLWKEDAEADCTLSGALDHEFEAAGIDCRVAVPGEHEEFWG